ncbi:hypothetical protein, partial [Acinetobacter sp. TUM15113]|uniref:hypothetical protein n=1 Tax=Acinetobacter sp. TUM15113 TaxID=2609140 RepID=UPI001C07A90B
KQGGYWESNAFTQNHIKLRLICKRLRKIVLFCSVLEGLMAVNLVLLIDLSFCSLHNRANNKAG